MPLDLPHGSIHVVGLSHVKLYYHAETENLKNQRLVQYSRVYLHDLCASITS